MAGISYREELLDSARTLAGGARVALGEWLSLPEWDWYTTHTFRENMQSPKLGDRDYYAWFNTLVMACKSRDLPRPFYFRVTERQDRGAIHYHSLIGGCEPVRRVMMKDFWGLNGFARVEKYDPARGAASYVAKYLTKPESDMRFSHNLTEKLNRGNLYVNG